MIKQTQFIVFRQTKVIPYGTVVRGSSHRNVISQPLVISSHGTQARVNVRKLNELAHYLAKANEIEDLKKEVRDSSFVSLILRRRQSS